MRFDFEDSGLKTNFEKKENKHEVMILKTNGFQNLIWKRKINMLVYLKGI